MSGNDIPKHGAMIMDGNGRWAQQRGYPRVFGHVRGTGRIKEIVRAANHLGVKALTLYAFSTENWSRPNTELAVLWKLMKKFIRKEQDELDQENVRLRMVGEVERLAPELQENLKALVKRLSKNTGLQLTIALSYGSRRELVHAAQSFAEDCLWGKCKPQELDDQLMQKYLWTSELGEFSDVDLVIRTSGEIRISNFLLWQAAYAEFIFLDLYWPDFRSKHFQAALGEYARRNRRFGGIGSKKVT